MTHTILRLVPAAVALLLVGGIAPAETLQPKFDPDRFVEGQAIDNKYFPLEPGRRAVLRAKGVEDGERIREKSVLTVLDDPGPRILGVRTITQLDKGYEDGLLVEKTRDYFAQDNRGNVWYMGEDVTNFRYDDNGHLIGKDHESEWRAGRHGADPGWIMPARQITGQRYFQEHARRDEALDKGKTLRRLDRLRVGETVYRNVLRVLETNPFEPGARDVKYYAPRVGLIREDEGVNRRLKDPDLIFRRDNDGGARVASRSARDGHAGRGRAGGGGGHGEKGGRRR